MEHVVINIWGCRESNMEMDDEIRGDQWPIIIIQQNNIENEISSNNQKYIAEEK